MPFAEDLSAFFDDADFAGAATLAGVSVTGIFDNGYDVGAVGSNGMATTSPRFELPSASVPQDAVGISLVYDGQAYTVVNVQPDGTGVTVLHLERAT